MSANEPENDCLSSNNNEDEDAMITEQKRSEIRQKISALSFEDLLKIKEEMGSKLYNETIFNVNKKAKNQFKRANKNRPREMSSKIKPSKQYKQISNTNRKNTSLKNVPRDPRFDPLCGQFDHKQFKSNYKFVNEIRIEDRKQLEKELKSCTDPGRQNTIKYLIQRMDNQIREEEKRSNEEHKIFEEKKQIKDKLKRGEKPIFKKKSVKKLENLIERYENLKRNNKLQKHILKRSKKLSAKFKKMNPKQG